jgi:hypothetical protein
MSCNKDTKLIWESYQNTLNEADEFSFDKLVHMGSEHYEKVKGSKEREEIYKEIEETYLTFFKNNMQQYSNADAIINYIEDGGFRDDMSNNLGHDEDAELDMIDRAINKFEF